MPKTMCSCLILLMGLFAVAGNRADVNADQVVNATDSVVLTNILAGNLSAANYDLYNLVVVAPTGGDFTDPADAADWVAGQHPDAGRRFIISLAAGTYTVDRPVTLPDYTTLRGQDRNQCKIVRNAAEAAWPYGAAVLTNYTFNAGIENLTIVKGDGATTAGTSAAVVFQDCISEIRDCTVSVSTRSDYAAPVWINTGTRSSYIKIYDCDITGRQSSDGQGDTSCINLLGDSQLEMYRCYLDSNNANQTGDAVGIFAAVPSSNNGALVYNTIMNVNATLSNKEYFFNRLSTTGHGRFYYCQILNGTTNVASGDTSLTMLYCIGYQYPYS